MEKIRAKNRIQNYFLLCPGRHLLLILSLILIAAQAVIRKNGALTRKICSQYIRPIHVFLSGLTAKLSFSLAEALIAVGVLCALLYLGFAVRALLKSEGKLKIVYKIALSFVTAGLTIYALSGFLWGIYYYGEDFIAQSGLKKEKISVEQLETVTAYFAALSNELSHKVTRDETGVYVTDKEAILACSDRVYINIEEKFPCLEGEEICAKGMVFSKIMSCMDFTGFFSAFTGEAHVNTDFPAAMFPSTVAHELSHQRGVAKEQEANFVAVLACMEYGEAEYCYSAALLAYTYLGNALYKADYESFVPIYRSLNENVLRDFEEDRLYWDKFKSPVSTVATGIYDNYLRSNDQELGMKSYGACVDLLVNYYYEEAVQYLLEKTHDA